MKTLLVIQHVPHEGLGTFEAAFKAAGCAVKTLRVADAKTSWPSPTAFASGAIDGLVVMGGPQSVYEQAKYLYIKREIALLQEAVKAKRPVLGVCLGAQLLAAALGAKVVKNDQKEIGWHPLMREPGADRDPMWEPFGQTETVFQWHGDTFALPKGAVQLASSPLCAQQAFCFSEYGSPAYGLQFHIEVTEPMIRLWLRANAAEIKSLKGSLDPESIRSQTGQHLSRMQELSRHVATTFSSLLKPSVRRPTHARQV